MTVLDDILAHVDERGNQEVCGLIACHGYGPPTVFRSRNLAADPERSFKLDPVLWAKLGGAVIGAYHSHPNGTCSPSEADIAAAEAMAVPMVIVGPEGVSRTVPVNWSVKLTQRPYAPPLYDCLALVADYYRGLGAQVVEPVRPRGAWWNRVDLVRSLAPSYGLVESSIDAAEEGDLLAFTMASDNPRHFGVYVGGNTFLHQRDGQLSGLEVLDDKWLRRLTGVYKYAGVKVSRKSS